MKTNLSSSTTSVRSGVSEGAATTGADNEGRAESEGPGVDGQFSCFVALDDQSEEGRSTDVGEKGSM